MQQTEIAYQFLKSLQVTFVVYTLAVAIVIWSGTSKAGHRWSKFFPATMARFPHKHKSYWQGNLVPRTIVFEPPANHCILSPMEEESDSNKSHVQSGRMLKPKLIDIQAALTWSESWPVSAKPAKIQTVYGQPMTPRMMLVEPGYSMI